METIMSSFFPSKILLLDSYDPDNKNWNAHSITSFFMLLPTQPLSHQIHFLKRKVKNYYNMVTVA